MMALIQFSYTSMKKLLMASSVAALVGFAPMDVEDLDDVDETGCDGWCNSRNLTLPPVMKHEM